MNFRSTPIFIICRDKLSPLTQLINWLEHSGYERIILVDNASTYAPLVDYLQASSHNVEFLPQNLGPYRAIWGTDLIGKHARDVRYVVTDPDVLPDENCPPDAVEFFNWALDRYPGYAKVGFGLRIDDLPGHYDHAAQVREWESQWWRRSIGNSLYHAAIDTTFALYRADSGFSFSALRSGDPYLARHLPWYTDSSNPSAEDVYYRSHCRSDLAHWDLSGERAAPIGRSTPLGTLRWYGYRWLRLQRNRSAHRSYVQHSRD